MAPRAVRPVRAKKRAAGLAEARLAGRITFGADTECIPVITSLADRQTSAAGFAALPAGRMPAFMHLETGPSGC